MLIREKHKLPRVDSLVIQTGHTEREEETEGRHSSYGFNDEIDPAPEYVSTSWSDSESHKALVKQGMVRYNSDISLLKKEVVTERDQFNGVPFAQYEKRTYRVIEDITITDKGKTLFKQQPDKNYWAMNTFQWDVEITGISMNDEKTSALVECQLIPKPLVSKSIIQALDIDQASPGKLQRVNMRKWDNGWRIEE